MEVTAHSLTCRKCFSCFMVGVRMIFREIRGRLCHVLPAQRLPMDSRPSTSQVLRPPNTLWVSNTGSGSSIESPRSLWVENFGVSANLWGAHFPISPILGPGELAAPPPPPPEAPPREEGQRPRWARVGLNCLQLPTEPILRPPILLEPKSWPPKFPFNHSNPALGTQEPSLGVVALTVHQARSV